MHEIFDGPLKRFLEKHLMSATARLVNIQGITVPEDIRVGLKLGELQEDFELKGLKNEPAEVENKMLDLAEKLYQCINLKCHKRSLTEGTCHYTIGGKGSGPGVILTYTMDPKGRRIIVTCINFDF